MPDTTGTEPAAPRLRTAALSHRRPTAIAWEPGPEGCRALARATGLRAIRSLRLAGELRPLGEADFALDARLEAEVTQSCVITLAPVPCRIAEPVLRRYIAGFAFPEAEETEMPEDDSQEPLPDILDIAEIAREALMLALPEWPRAPGATLGEVVQPPPGVAPLREADLNPFASLARLRDSDGDAG